MTAQIQPTVRQPAASRGKHLAWVWRVVNVVVIVSGILCGYSLESRHHASAAELPAVQTTAESIHAPR